MGGCSSTNYLVYMRGNKKDYNDWASLGNEGWSYGDVNIIHITTYSKNENRMLTKSYISGTAIF